MTRLFFEEQFENVYFLAQKLRPNGRNFRVYELFLRNVSKGSFV